MPDILAASRLLSFCKKELLYNFAELNALLVGAFDEEIACALLPESDVHDVLVDHLVAGILDFLVQFLNLCYVQAAVQL